MSWILVDFEAETTQPLLSTSRVPLNQQQEERIDAATWLL